MVPRDVTAMERSYKRLCIVKQEDLKAGKKK